MDRANAENGVHMNKEDDYTTVPDQSSGCGGLALPVDRTRESH